MPNPTCQFPGCGVALDRKPGRGRNPKWCATHRRAKQASYGSDSRSKVCKSPGCDRPLRAKGLCSSHYNQTFQADRHRRMVSAQCSACGVPISKAESNSKGRRPVCSYRCRYRITHGRWPEDGRALVGPVPRRPLPRREIAIPAPKAYRRVFVQGDCAWCGESFTALNMLGGSASRYCSKRCAKRSAKTKKFIVSDRVRLLIYERDGWSCQICGGSASTIYGHSDPWAPTLDHIVPRSKGGSDDPENLRLAHAWCNSVRNDLSRPESLQVFAS